MKHCVQEVNQNQVGIRHMFALTEQYAECPSQQMNIWMIRVAIGNSLSVLGFYNLCVQNEIKDILKEPRQQENNQQNGGYCTG